MRFVGMGVLVAGSAVLWKYEHQIKQWFYDNMMFFVLGGFVLLALVVMRVLSNIKKKEAEVIARMRAVNQVRPERREENYYERRKK